MQVKTKRTKQEVAEAMGEIEPRYRTQEAKVEADRCLYCFDAPCIMACPTGIDIPGFIKKNCYREFDRIGQSHFGVEYSWSQLRTGLSHSGSL